MGNTRQKRLLKTKTMTRGIPVCLSFLLALGLSPANALAEESYPDADRPVVAPSTTGEPTVDVGNITVDTEQAGNAPAAFAHSEPGEDATLNVHGDVEVGGTDTYSADAVEAYSTGSTATVDVDGNVKTEVTSDTVPPTLEDSTRYANGVNAFATDSNSEAIVNVDGDVDVAIHTPIDKHALAKGVHQLATSYDTGQQASSHVTVNGDVTSVATGDSGEAIGIMLGCVGDSNATTTIAGKVTAQGSTAGATGADIELLGASPAATQATITIGKGGITATADDGVTGIFLNNRKSLATLRVAGDVTATATQADGEAIGIFADGEAGTSDVFVDGTITGKTAGIFSTMSGGKLEVTVWKVDSALVAAKWNASSQIVDDATTRKAIDYIIRLEQPAQGNILRLVGATAKEITMGDQTRSYDVARMDQKVYLDVEKGWVITSAFSDEGRTLKLEQDADGRWYVVVPNGGGVYLTAQVARQFPLTFDLSGGSVGGVTGTYVMDAPYGSIVALPTPTREGFTFLYWEGSRYEAGAAYTVLGAHSFRAIWQKNEPAPVTPANTGAVTTAAAAPAYVAQGTPNTGDSLAFPAVAGFIAVASLAVALFAFGQRARLHDE